MRDAGLRGVRLARAEHGPLRIARLAEQTRDFIRVSRRRSEAVAHDKQTQ